MTLYKWDICYVRHFTRGDNCPHFTRFKSGHMSHEFRGLELVKRGGRNAMGGGWVYI